MLELDGGLAGVQAGQAALARAIKLDASLAGRPVEYRTDEAVYRARFAGGPGVVRIGAMTTTSTLAQQGKPAPGRTERKGRKMSHAFVQVEAHVRPRAGARLDFNARKSDEQRDLSG